MSSYREDEIKAWYVYNDSIHEHFHIIAETNGKLGMTKTYRLTYESVEVMHALFDKTSASQGWKISSRVLREYVEYFAPKAEQLDLYAENGKAVFTSFTEKVDDGKREYPAMVSDTNCADPAP